MIILTSDIIRCGGWWSCGNVGDLLIVAGNVITLFGLFIAAGIDCIICDVANCLFSSEAWLNNCWADSKHLEARLNSVPGGIPQLDEESNNDNNNNKQWIIIIIIKIIIIIITCVYYKLTLRWCLS